MCHHPLSENYGQRALPDNATATATAKRHAGFIVNILWPIARDRYRARPDQLLWTGLNEPQVWSTEPPEQTALYYVESGGNPNAINSQSKATGLGQIMPREAGGPFVDRPTQAELLNPETNIQWMVKIYSGNYERYKNSIFPLERALCAYYGGSPLGNNLLADDSLVYLRAFMRKWRVLFTDPCIIKLPDKSASEYQLALSQGVWYI